MAQEKEQGLIKYESRGQEVTLSVAIVRDFLVTGKKELVTDQEIFYFLGICKARQLNPFVKDCYLVKFDSNPAAIITAIDFYRSRARAAQDCTGWEAGVICLNKETGELRYSKGLVLPNEELVGGWFKARPTGWHVDCELEVNLSGYAKDNVFWKGGKAATMIAKVAESQGLRRVWPDLFQGTYTADERNFDLDNLDAGGPPPPGSPGDITPKAEPEKLDTSKFDKAVKKLKWDKEIHARLEKWLADTATGASNKAGKVITVDMIKISCSNRFEEFLAKFKEWQEVNYPPPGAPQETATGQTKGPLSPEAIQHGKEEWEKDHPPEADATTEAPPGEERPAAVHDPEVKPLADRKQTAWHRVIELGIPLTNLAVVHVSTLADINEDNIGELEELVATYQAATGRGKKK